MPWGRFAPLSLSFPLALLLRHCLLLPRGSSRGAPPSSLSPLYDLPDASSSRDQRTLGAHCVRHEHHLRTLRHRLPTAAATPKKFEIRVPRHDLPQDLPLPAGRGRARLLRATVLGGLRPGGRHAMEHPQDRLCEE